MMPEAPTRFLSVLGAKGWIERQSLFITALAGGAAVILSQVPRHMNQDGWLGLVAGREVWDHGLPDTERLTVWSRGVDWIDQQWLSQLGMYGAHELGGMALVALSYVVLTLSGLAIAIAGARMLGASERQVVIVLLPAAFLFIAASMEIRTQGVAYPLFALVFWLLAADSRQPQGRQAFWVFAVLVLWGNLHGTVTLGVALACLHGLLLVARGPRGRGALFLVFAPLCLLVSPYFVDGLDYYKDTLLDPGFRAVIAEWQPITFNWFLAVPFFGLAFAAAHLLGQARGRVPLFDQLALVFLAAAAISTIRNVTWFGLACVVVLPNVLRVLSADGPPPARNERINLAMAGMAMGVLAITILVVALQPRTWFEEHYDQRTPARVLALVERNPGALVFADEHFGDWLLWREPALAEKVAYDARFELLSHRRLDDISDFTSYRGPDFADATRGFDVLVLDPDGKPLPTKALIKAAAPENVTRGDGVVIIDRGSK